MLLLPEMSATELNSLLCGLGMDTFGRPTVSEATKRGDISVCMLPVCGTIVVVTVWHFERVYVCIDMAFSGCVWLSPVYKVIIIIYF